MTSVSRLEQRPFVASDGSVKVSSTPSNSYYHLKMQCLLNADPNFTIDTYYSRGCQGKIPSSSQKSFAMSGSTCVAALKWNNADSCLTKNESIYSIFAPAQPPYVLLQLRYVSNE